MKLKNLEEFINESHTVDYLSVIINKLKSEGKSIQTIYTYLDLINIPKDRILQAMMACGCPMTNESVMNEEDKSDELADLVDDVDDEAEKEKDPEEEDEKDDDKGEAKPEGEEGEGSDALKKVIGNVELLAKGVKKIKDIVNDKDSDSSEEE